MQEFDLPKVYNWEKASTKIPTIYKALLTQTGTADPVATVFENTLKTNIIWTRNSVGEYTGTLEGGTFDVGGTFILMSMSTYSGPWLPFAGVNPAAPNTITINTYEDFATAEDLHGSLSIEVQVYI